MTCLVGKVNKPDSFVGSLSRGQRIDGRVERRGEHIDGEIERQGVIVLNVVIGNRLSGSCGLVCSIPEELAIRFAKSNLTWEGETNNEGVILYNTLIATGDWSLEELKIEELL